MLSQLNLRFHKKLIEALKTRAGREKALLQIVGGDKLIIPFC